MEENYQLLQKVGSGNFSVVHLVRHRHSKTLLAMKIMKTHPNIALKEAQLLKQFDHPNITRLHDFSQDTQLGESRMVLEYLPENTLDLYEQQPSGLQQEQVKCILFQAALALAYIHRRGIIHRDIKPQNIMIDKGKAVVKLIDFGLAISRDKINTDYVATRWYRSPQNLLGTRQYTTAIDVFSLACVVVELYLGRPLFPGADNLDQLHKICSILGQPTTQSWPKGHKQFIKMGLTVPGGSGQGSCLGQILQTSSPGLRDLLARMLVLNPADRISSSDMLTHAYFHNVKTIIPPPIYRRYQQDHQLLKKSKSNDAIEQAQKFIRNNKSKSPENNRQTQQLKTMLSPAHQATTIVQRNVPANAGSVLKKTIDHSPRQREVSGLTPSGILSPKKGSTAFPMPKQATPLFFKGFHPLKNHKISIKQVKKPVQEPIMYRQSRNNSINSLTGASGNSSMIRSNIHAPTGSPQPIVVKRLTSNEIVNPRDMRNTPEPRNRLGQRKQVLYYNRDNNLKGDRDKSTRGMGQMTFHSPIPDSARLNHQHLHHSPTPQHSQRMTRHHSATQLIHNRINAPQPYKRVTLEASTPSLVVPNKAEGYLRPHKQNLMTSMHHTPINNPIKPQQTSQILNSPSPILHSTQFSRKPQPAIPNRQGRLKSIKSLEHKEIGQQLWRLFGKTPQKKHAPGGDLLSRVKVVGDNKEYREPRLMVNKQTRKEENLSSMLYSPTPKDPDRNININLNVSIIEADQNNKNRTPQ